MRQRPRVSWLRPLITAAAVMLLVSTPANASPASRQRTREAFRQAYALNFDAAYKTFAEAAALDGSDPAPSRGVAAIAWIETLLTQGVGTFEAFTGQISSKADIVRPVVPAALITKFRTHLDRALLLAQTRLKASADADAHYQLGATEALSALHLATVEGRTFGSFAAARRSVKAMERARALDPTKREPALVLGMSRYTVSTMSAPVRMLAGMAGLSGGSAEGIALLEEAASPGAETETDALLVLMIVYNREGRHQHASERLAKLRSAYPSNRLIALNQAATAIEASNFERAELPLREGLALYSMQRDPQVLGEEALWYLKMGTTRAALGRTAEAEDDLNKVLTLHPREWVRGRAHLELAKMAIVRGEVEPARRHFAHALDFARRSGDRVTVSQVQAHLKHRSPLMSRGVMALPPNPWRRHAERVDATRLGLDTNTEVHTI